MDSKTIRSTVQPMSLSSGVSSHDTELRFECSLHGCVQESGFDEFHEKIVAILGRTSQKNLYVHEIVGVSFLSKQHKSTTKGDSVIRFQNRIDSNLDKHESQTWRLLHYGNPETGARRNATIRSLIDVPIDVSPIDLMTILGYEFDYEFVRVGYQFELSETTNLNMVKIYKLQAQGDLETQIPLDANNWLIELSGTCNQEYVATLLVELQNFANTVSDLVELTKVDHRVLQQRV